MVLLAGLRLEPLELLDRALAGLLEQPLLEVFRNLDRVDRKSPSSSSSTVAWRDEPGVFLYAARSASSSAWISVSPSMPFSRSIVRTASMISLVIVCLPFVDQVAPHDRLVGDVYGFVLRADRHGPLAGVDHLAAQRAA